LGEESELTDLTELEEKIVSGSPSPRRLRSREKRGGVSDDQESDTPKQRGRARRQTSRGDEAENCLEDEEEVDELISSPSPTPPPMQGRATPAKRRLRPRRLQTHTPPSDGGEGDDEEEADEEEVEEGVEMNEDGSSMDDEESEQSEDSRDVDGDDDVDVEETSSPPPTTTPRKLRNGKVVGEECQEEEPGEDEEQDDNESVDLEAEDIDIDAEGEDEVEDIEEAEEIDEAIDGDDCWFVFSWFLMLLTQVLQSISPWPPRRPFSVCVAITLSGCARLGIWMLLVRSLNSRGHSFSGEINEQASSLHPLPQAPFVHHQPFITALMAGERSRAAAKAILLQSSCAPIEFIKTNHARLLCRVRTQLSLSKS
jgi:hypothetical protein